MGVKSQIHEMDEYQSAAQPESPGDTPRQPAAGGTVRDSLSPVLDREKSDVEFWMQVAQVVLLFLILRELQNGGSR